MSKSELYRPVSKNSLVQFEGNCLGTKKISYVSNDLNLQDFKKIIDVSISTKTTGKELYIRPSKKISIYFTNNLIIIYDVKEKSEPNYIYTLNIEDINALYIVGDMTESDS